MTTLLLCLAAFILLVLAMCAAVRVCHLEQVDLRANVLKLAVFSFTVKSRAPEGKPPARPPARRRPRKGR